MDFSGRYEAEVTARSETPASARATSNSTTERVDIARDAPSHYRVRLAPKGQPACDLTARRENGYELEFESGQTCTRGGGAVTLLAGHARGGPAATRPDGITFTLAWTSTSAEGTATLHEDLHVPQSVGCF